MKRTKTAPFPRMRKERLIVDELPDEVLVYDLDRHKAHCLNGTAGMVWRRCDGRTPPGEIARRVQEQLDQPFKEEMVWVALRQLNQNHLLKEPMGMPPKQAGMSRREMMRALGIGAVVAVPLVTSIVSPTAAQAVSCFHGNHTCTKNTDCCSNDCGPGPTRVCVGG